MTSSAVAWPSDTTAGIVVEKKPAVPLCVRNGVENNSQLHLRPASSANNGEADRGTHNTVTPSKGIPSKDASSNGYNLIVSSPDKGGMSDELKE